MVRFPLSRWRSGRDAAATATVVAIQSTALEAPRVLALARAEPGRGVVRLAVTETAGLGALRSDGLFRDARCVLLLDASQRQLLVLDAPAVEPGEWAQALRFPVAKALETEPDDVAFDHAAVPPLADAGRPQVLVAASRLGGLRTLLTALEERGVRPDAVDVVDMAQRNLVLASAATAPTGGTIVVGATGRELMVGLVADDELCVARNVSLPSGFSASRHDESVAERLALHVQRTVDLFERQITRFAITGACIVADDFAAQTVVALQAALPMTLRPIALDDIGPGVARPAGVEPGTLARLSATAVMRSRSALGFGPRAAAPRDAGRAVTA